jgi:hypothetical protein
MAVQASRLRGSPCGRRRAKLQASNHRLANVHEGTGWGTKVHRDALLDGQPV